MPNLIYLAQPYSHPEEIVRQIRHSAARNVTAALMARAAVFSPIVHGVSVESLLPTHCRYEHEFWMRQCYAQLRRADMMYVLPLVGWRESRGLQEELAFAHSAQIPVAFLLRYKHSSQSPWAQLEAPSAEECYDNDWGTVHA